MENFTPVPAFTGGLLIGAAAALLMLFNGRIAGVSGILGELVDRSASDRVWRLYFLAGLVGSAAVYGLMVPGSAGIALTGSIPVLILGGLIVGYGTRLGGGCTSGHGVCGMARLSYRSITATATFMAVAAVTVFVVRHAIGGGA